MAGNRNEEFTVDLAQRIVAATGKPCLMPIEELAMRMGRIAIKYHMFAPVYHDSATDLEVLNDTDNLAKRAKDFASALIPFLHREAQQHLATPPSSDTFRQRALFESYFQPLLAHLRRIDPNASSPLMDLYSLSSFYDDALRISEAARTAFDDLSASMPTKTASGRRRRSGKAFLTESHQLDDGSTSPAIFGDGSPELLLFGRDLPILYYAAFISGGAPMNRRMAPAPLIRFTQAYAEAAGINTLKGTPYAEDSIRTFFKDGARLRNPTAAE